MQNHSTIRAKITFSTVLLKTKREKILILYLAVLSTPSKKISTRIYKNNMHRNMGNMPKANYLTHIVLDNHLPQIEMPLYHQSLKNVTKNNNKPKKDIKESMTLNKSTKLKMSMILLIERSWQKIECITVECSNQKPGSSISSMPKTMILIVPSNYMEKVYLSMSMT